MGLFDGLLKDGVSVLGNAIGGMAKDIRTAITGKESITADERMKILEATSKMETMALQADLAINQGQIEINKIEASSTSFFKSGWRPATGWICVLGLAYQFLIMPIAPWLLTTFGAQTYSLPSLDIGTLLTLLGGLLGLGTFRTVEKAKGIS